MENASTALLIAGGMILAALVISIFIFGYSNVTKIAQAKVESELKEEVEKFNDQYLAFNKTAMYGTDVISVMNLAISNNKLNNLKFGESSYVDVSFKLTKDTIEDKVYEYKLDERTSRYDKKLIEKNKTLYGANNFTFEKNKKYSLSSNLEPITAFLKTANQSEETKEVLELRGKIVLKYTIKYTGIADFKRKTFKCSKVDYDSDGRIKVIQFEQIQESVYKGG